jgi:hypothetical protein
MTAKCRKSALRPPLPAHEAARIFVLRDVTILQVHRSNP